MNIKTQRLLSIGLSALNVAGVIGTFIFVAKETPKAKEEMDKLPKEAKKMTKVKTFAKNYKRSLIFAGATIATGVASRVISYKTETSLIATAYMLDASLHKYKNKVKQALGIDADKSVIKEIMKDQYDEKKANNAEKEANDELWFEEHIGYFYAKKEDIYKALLTINEDISGNNSWYHSGYYSPGYVTIGQFLTLCNGKPLSHNLDDSKLNYGWSMDYLYEFYEYYWIHYDVSEPDENGARLIYWFEDPIWNPECWYDYYFDNCTKEDYFEGFKGDYNKLDSQYYVKSKK